MRVGGFFDKHHGREIVEIPIGWDLDKTGVRTFLEGFHPMVGVFAVVDWGPFIARAKVVGEAVMVGEAVIFDGVSR